MIVNSDDGTNILTDRLDLTEESDENFDSSRRRFLLANAGLLAAGTFGFADPSHAMSWSFERYQHRPENTKWRILDAHDTGYVSQRWRRRGIVKSRIRLEPAPNGRKAYRHHVKKRQIVDPIRVDSLPIKVNFKNFNRVLLRYHHWIDDYSYLPGKWMSLQIGRGWVGRRYVQRDTRTYGTDGASATTMHPALSRGNAIRLLATHTRQKSPYGQNFGRSRKLMPKGRWVTVDTVIDKNKGYRLYVDGVKTAQSHKVKPVKNWNACKAIWYRTRLMHGGKPSKLPAVNNYSEWFGGFFVGVA